MESQILIFAEHYYDWLNADNAGKVALMNEIRSVASIETDGNKEIIDYLTLFVEILKDGESEDAIHQEDEGRVIAGQRAQGLIQKRAEEVRAHEQIQRMRALAGFARDR